MSMITKVISGGQTGVDQIALYVAKMLGIPTGGNAPKGWITEAGPAPWLANYGLVETFERGYPPRTLANVANSDGTLWIGDSMSTGGRCTIRACQEMGKTHCAMKVEPSMSVDYVIPWIRRNKIKVLNVAGNRGSKLKAAPFVESLLHELFTKIGNQLTPREREEAEKLIAEFEADVARGVAKGHE